MEAELEALHATMADPSTWKASGDELAALSARSESLPLEIEQLYARWEALEARADV
jgi:hypothetical protein